MRIKSIHSIAVAGVFVFYALLTLGARRTSLTADEPTYIALGYGLLARGEQAFPLLTQRGYTPLSITVEALPLYLGNLSIPVERLEGWPIDYSLFAKAFLSYLTPIAQAKLLARIPIIWLTVLMGAVIYRWGREMWGSWGGLLTLGVLVFDPLLLAHGRLANSDASAVALGTVALYATWRWRQKPSWLWALATGALLGLTALAKASGLLWAAASGVSVLSTILRRERYRSRHLLSQAIFAITLGSLVLWAGYGFEWGHVPGLALPVPAPTHWRNLLYLDRYTDTYFALGLSRQGGWWWYFFLAFLIKNPLPLLICLAVASVVLLRRPFSWDLFLTLGFFPLLYLCVALLEGMNIGYRFMLPVHPFIYLAIGGGLGQWTLARSRLSARSWLLGALGAWYATTTLWVFPSEIAYFNELVGGPDGGYRYLSDSNVDWGQSSDVLQTYLQEHPTVHAEPPVSWFNPAPGRYIVGASSLQGVGTGAVLAYEWFRHREPVEILAHSLLIYQVPSRELSWIAQCNVPSTPLDQASVQQGSGQHNLRHGSFDCTTSWLYPQAGTTEGIYVLHHDLLSDPRLCLPFLLACPASASDSFVARHLAHARLSYEQAYNSQLPAFALYESIPTAVQSPVPMAIYAVPAGTLPSGSASPLNSPVSLEGPLAFLGMATYSDRGALDVETWWQVTECPVTRPFSIMAHLASVNGEVTAVADGLGVSPVSLVTGDVIVQRHRFSEHAPGSEAWLLTGAYWLDTMKRWTLQSFPAADTLAIPVQVGR